MKNIVVFDVDGVMADFEGQLVRHLEDVFGAEGRSDRSKFMLEERYSGKVLKLALSLTENPNFYYPLPVIDGGVSMYEICVGLGYGILFLSSRPKLATTHTRRWLKRHIGSGEYYAVCGVSDKANYLEEYRDSIEFVVDDNPKTVEELKAAGFDALCWGQPWNEEVFPRLYERSDGVVMIWEDETIEAEPLAVRLMKEREGA